jgi:hypothetical protein
MLGTITITGKAQPDQLCSSSVTGMRPEKCLLPSCAREVSAGHLLVFISLPPLTFSSEEHSLLQQDPNETDIWFFGLSRSPPGSAILWIDPCLGGVGRLLRGPTAASEIETVRSVWLWQQVLKASSLAVVVKKCLCLRHCKCLAFHLIIKPFH